MPSFGASGSVSGPSGMNSGPQSRMRMAVDGVAESPPVAAQSGPSSGGRPTPRGGIANGTGPNVSGPFFNSQFQMFRQFWIISGITRDSAGAALGNCVVNLFQTQGNVFVATTTSDASGNYSFSVPGNSSASFVVAYKAGSPDVSGTTLNTLIPTLT